MANQTKLIDTFDARPSQRALCDIVDQVFAADLAVKRNAEEVREAKDYILRHMERHGLGKVVGDQSEAYLCDNPPAVKVADDVKLPANFTTRAPDKAALIAAWRDGELPAGVTVTQGSSLRFKPL